MRGPGILPFMLSLAFMAGSAEGQPPQLGRVELFGGLALTVPHLDTTLTSSYAPGLRYGTVTSSSAGQTLQIAGDNGLGVEFGAAFFFTEAAGLQVLFGSDTFDVQGTNGPYATHLEYFSVQPPDYTPRPVVIDNVQAWPDTEGQVTVRQLSVNAVGRWRLGRHVAGQLSGGLTYFRMGGVVSPVGYTVYHVGGHGVLFPEEYQLELALDRAGVFGFNAGGTFDIELGRGLALTADVRYFAGGALSSPTSVARIVNLDEIGMLDEIESIQEGLHPPAVKLEPDRLRVFAGLKIRL